jgi:hypothetical protein
VKVDADDFRRVYESLNDEALLAVNRDELVEVAQQCYDVEVAKRGLTASADAAAGPALASAEAASEELVEVATFTDADDARLARDLLASAEIPSYLATDAKLPGNMSVPADSACLSRHLCWSRLAKFSTAGFPTKSLRHKLRRQRRLSRRRSPKTKRIEPYHSMPEAPKPPR